MDDEQFFDRIPQESHPTAGAHVGLGTKEELDIQIGGCSTVIPLGDYETWQEANARGAPQGPVQGCHVGNTCAMPMMHAINQRYSSHSADIMRTNIMRYVDDSACFATEEPRTKGSAKVPHPAQGMLVDATTYFWALMQIDTPHKKVQYYSDGKHQTVVLPTKECREAHLGSFWTTDTPDQREEVLKGGTEVSSDSQVTYLGCTICFTSGARVPHDIEEIRRDA